MKKAIPVELSQLKQIIEKANARITNARTEYSHLEAWRNKILVEMMFYTGLRSSDVLNIQKSNISLSNRTIAVVEKKTGKTNILTIQDSFINELGSYMAANPHQYLFWSREGDKISRVMLFFILKELGAGICTQFSAHSIRKLYAITLYRVSDNDISLVMNALNHSSARNTLHYMNLTESRLSNLRNKLTLN